MFHLEDQQMVDLDKKLARRFAKMRPCPGQRPVTKRRMDYLHRRYIEGNFHTPCWASCRTNGTDYLMNGQHTARMVLQVADFPVSMKVFVMNFKADSVEDLPELFAQFDSKYSQRNASDIAGAHGGLHPELSELTGQDLSRVCFAIAISDTDCWALCRNRRPDEEERARLIHDDHNTDFALWVQRLIKHPSTNQAGVLAAAYRTWMKDSHFADVFWVHVVKESHPDPNHPSRMLAKLLVSRKADKGTARWSVRRFMVHSLRAWNAARTKKPIKSLGLFKNKMAIPLTK